MKKILLITIVLIILCLGAIYQNNSNLNLIVFKLLNKNDLKEGDLVYRVTLLSILPAGEAIFTAEKKEKYNDKMVYHLEATAQTLKALSKFFSARVALESYIDMQDNNPLLFKQKIKILGKPDIDKQITYDQKNGIMSMAGVERSILPNTQDFLSAMFNLKHMDLSKINDLEMNINTNQKNYLLKGTVTPREILINKKIYKTYLINADIGRRDKNPYHKSKITMELLSNKENIPILIRVFTAGVLINAKLVEIR